MFSIEIHCNNVHKQLSLDHACGVVSFFGYAIAFEFDTLCLSHKTICQTQIVCVLGFLVQQLVLSFAFVQLYFAMIWTLMFLIKYIVYSIVTRGQLCFSYRMVCFGTYSFNIPCFALILITVTRLVHLRNFKPKFCCHVFWVVFWWFYSSPLKTNSITRYFYWILELISIWHCYNIKLSVGLLILVMKRNPLSLTTVFTDICSIFFREDSVFYKYNHYLNTFLLFVSFSQVSNVNSTQYHKKIKMVL